MYDNFDYSNPSFAITTPSLLTNKGGDCPPNHQIVELLTVANYEHWKHLKIGDQRIYKNKKMEILDTMIDIIEKEYIPGFRDHLVFKMTGGPTTNERYCWCPEGNSYGSNMTPENIGPGRLSYKSSLKNFYFCNASSGFAGFAGTFWTGATLYERLTGDKVL
jgi:phytoene dehydrogenase-like protein